MMKNAQLMIALVMLVLTKVLRQELVGSLEEAAAHFRAFTRH